LIYQCVQNALGAKTKMKAVAEYRKNAQRCRELVKRTRRTDDRATLEGMAESWERLAVQRECLISQTILLTRPILFGLEPYDWRGRVLDLEPVVVRRLIAPARRKALCCPAGAGSGSKGWLDPVNTT
jgi:hypothetical protein